MKILPLLSTIAALVAFVLFQFSFETSVSILFGAGLVGLLIADYARVIRPHQPRLSVVTSEAQRIERYRLAA